MHNIKTNAPGSNFVTSPSGQEFAFSTAISPCRPAPGELPSLVDETVYQYQYRPAMLRLNDSSPWQLIPLQQLETGRTAMIDQLVGRPDQVHRLQELGLRQGVVVEMVRHGSPCIVRLGDCKFCFREADLFSVLVRSAGPSS